MARGGLSRRTAGASIMTIRGFVVSHAEGARFERGLRSLFEYRDLGVR
jgi:hypothetical protein